MPELRIALIMGGGVSLGSFSAGALARVVRLLEYVERGPARIDVVTGASAGSMTLAVMLYHLFRGSSLERIEESLRNAWVRGISFDALRPNLSDHRTPSLFSDRAIRTIAANELPFTRWEEGVAPHPYFADGTLVSFALTNLNGVPVRAEGQIIRQSGGSSDSGRSSVFADALQTTFHDDAIRFCLSREDVSPPECHRARARLLTPWRTPEMREKWRQFREAAIASGAFPAAFPPVRIPRERFEYEIWPEELDREAFIFDYVDGGVLRNEPLREAIELAGIRDEGKEVERVFIFIDPNVSGTREVYPLPFNQSIRVVRETDDWGEPRSIELETPGYIGRLQGVLARFVSVLSSQAAFRDWLRAAKVNSQIEWRNELLAIVAELEPRVGSDVEERLDQALEGIYREKVARSVSKPDDGAETIALRARIATDLAARTVTGISPFTTKLTLLMDLVANLREKRKLNMVAITPSSSHGSAIPLAGDFLSNFGGFFNQRYREHDFEAGEYMAGEVLTAPISGASPLLRPEAPRAPRPGALDLDPAYRHLSWGIQKQFEELVADHARNFAPMIGLPKFLHGVFADRVSASVRSTLVAKDGAIASFVVQITGAESLFLRAGPLASDVGADSNGALRTVVVVTEGTIGARNMQLAGPHLITGTEGGRPVLEVWRRRWPRPSQKIASIVLTGAPESWYRRSHLSGKPVLTIDLPAQPEVLVTPEDLIDSGYTAPE